jgi:diguanylate cyclase (GGDEF)-like protein
VAQSGPRWLAWLREPLVATMGFIFVAGLMAFSLYMRRALQHLDPANVIPERVQGAFDAMAEGVAVLDIRGRLLLANRAFRALNAHAAGAQAGQALSALPWSSAGLGPHAATHPWTRAMGERAPQAGQTVEIELDGADERRQLQQLVINAAPIMDSGGRVRGCLATFSDVTPLHRANLQLRQMMDNLKESEAKVQRQNEELKRLATQDPMTGCLNRRAFTESYELMFHGAKTTGMALSCLVLDIDLFKKVNDTHGHSVGDRVIQEVARRLHAQTRASDLVCRYGGEEFCVVLPGSSIEEARQTAERMRRRIESECGPAVKEVPGMRVTVSIGVATLAESVTTPLELIDRADQALYDAKKGGRNQVRVHGQAGRTESAKEGATIAQAH